MKSNQRITLTKRLLQEGILRLIEKKPLDKVSVSELCEEAGINRATFYRHYHVPRDVLLEMQAQFVTHIQENFDMNALINSPAQYVEEVCVYLHKNVDLVKIFIQNNSSEEIICLFDDFFQTMLSQNEGIRQVYTFDETEIKLISAFMSGGGYFMLRRWLLHDIKKSPQQIAQLVMSFLEPENMRNYALRIKNIQ